MKNEQETFALRKICALALFTAMAFAFASCAGEGQSVPPTQLSGETGTGAEIDYNDLKAGEYALGEIGGAASETESGGQEPGDSGAAESGKSAGGSASDGSKTGKSAEITPFASLEQKKEEDKPAQPQTKDLVIPIASVTQNASFYPINVDGTMMEVVAVKTSDGAIRTAFNTCQVCYDSGRGYYVQQGNALVCQNCGNQFAMNQIEVQSGGCNPWPIFAPDKTVRDGSIVISYDFLAKNKAIFANWKK